MISDTLQLDSNVEVKEAWYVPVMLRVACSLRHAFREHLSEQINTLADHLGTLDELESYTSQFVIVGDIEFKLEYLDVFLEKFGVCRSVVSHWISADSCVPPD